MISRKSLIEILLALFITGCVVFIAEKGSEESPVLGLSFFAPKTLLKDDSSRKFRTMQNCSLSGQTLQTIRYYNATLNSTVTVTVNSSASCTTQSSVLIITTTSQSVITYPFTSPPFQMTLNLDCMTSTSTITAIVARLLGIDASTLTITSTSCGSLIVTYTCGSLSSSSDATSLCNYISTAACNPSSALGQTLQGTSCGMVNQSTKGSSAALFGLFALVAIPILILFGLFLWYRTSQREADNQYMQDTATFSNVATAPQPLGPAPLYPSPAAPVATP
jgi:hypothetical protein